MFLLEDIKEEVPNEMGDEFDEESVALTFHKRRFNNESQPGKICNEEIKTSLNLAYTDTFKIPNKTNDVNTVKVNKAVTNEKICILPNIDAKSIDEDDYDSKISIEKNAKNDMNNIYYNPDYLIPNSQSPKKYIQTDAEVALRKELCDKQANNKEYKLDLSRNSDEFKLRKNNDDKSDNDDERVKDLENKAKASLYYSIRFAIQGEYFPKSVSFMNIISCLLIVIVLCAGIIDIVIEKRLCNNIKDNVSNVKLGDRKSVV